MHNIPIAIISMHFVKDEGWAKYGATSYPGLVLLPNLYLA